MTLNGCQPSSVIALKALLSSAHVYWLRALYLLLIFIDPLIFPIYYPLQLRQENAPAAKQSSTNAVANRESSTDKTEGIVITVQGDQPPLAAEEEREEGEISSDDDSDTVDISKGRHMKQEGVLGSLD